jgi:hypothetical protein
MVSQSAPLVGHIPFHLVVWASPQMPMEMEIMLFSVPQIMPPIWGAIMPNYAAAVHTFCKSSLLADTRCLL